MNPTKKSPEKKTKALKPSAKRSPAEKAEIEPKKVKKAPVKAKAAAAEAPKEKEAPHRKEPAHGPMTGLRIRLSAFDHRVLDEAAGKIIDTAERSGAIIHGPIPLPTKLHKFTVNKSTFVHKNARDQYEMRIHRRLIDLTETTFKTVESLQNLSLPSGVDIEIKMR